MLQLYHYIFSYRFILKKFRLSPVFAKYPKPVPEKVNKKLSIFSNALLGLLFIIMFL